MPDLFRGCCSLGPNSVTAEELADGPNCCCVFANLRAPNRRRARFAAPAACAADVAGFETFLRGATGDFSYCGPGGRSSDRPWRLRRDVPQTRLGDGAVSARRAGRDVLVGWHPERFAVGYLRRWSIRPDRQGWARRAKMVRRLPGSSGQWWMRFRRKRAFRITRTGPSSPCLGERQAAAAPVGQRQFAIISRKRTQGARTTGMCMGLLIVAIPRSRTLVRRQYIRAAIADFHGSRRTK